MKTFPYQSGHLFGKWAVLAGSKHARLTCFTVQYSEVIAIALEGDVMVCDISHFLVIWVPQGSVLCIIPYKTTLQLLHGSPLE